MRHAWLTAIWSHQQVRENEMKCREKTKRVKRGEIKREMAFADVEVRR